MPQITKYFNCFPPLMNDPNYEIKGRNKLRFVKNYKSSHQKDFVTRIKGAIGSDIFFWFHKEAGYVYSQEYANKIIAIARRCPHTHFLLILHFELEKFWVWKGKPKNLHIYRSPFLPSLTEFPIFNKNSKWWE